MSRSAHEPASEDRVLLNACRQLCADADPANSRPPKIRAEIDDVPGSPGARMRGTVVAARTADHWHAKSRAAALIDDHGRWARHVAFRCAAEEARLGDSEAERFWCSVVAAIKDMQTRPA